MSCCDTIDIHLQNINGRRQLVLYDWIRVHSIKYLKVYNPDGSELMVYVRTRCSPGTASCSMCALAGKGQHRLIRKQICDHMLGCLNNSDSYWDKVTTVMEEL